MNRCVCLHLLGRDMLACSLLYSVCANTQGLGGSVSSVCIHPKPFVSVCVPTTKVLLFLFFSLCLHSKSCCFYFSVCAYTHVLLFLFFSLCAYTPSLAVSVFSLCLHPSLAVSVFQFVPTPQVLLFLFFSLFVHPKPFRFQFTCLAIFSF